MNTFLLYWNPFFSSYKLDRFLDEFDFPDGVDVLTEFEEWDHSPNDFDWSILEHEKAHVGDRFVFVKVGYDKPTGIVGVGHFTTEPFISEDWSGQGRKIYYMKMEWESVIKPTSDKILKTDVLTDAIPEITWSKGKAGVMIAPEVAEKVETLWHDHLLNLLRRE